MGDGYKKGVRTVSLEELKILLLARAGGRILGYAELADLTASSVGLSPGVRGSKMHRTICRMEADGLVAVGRAPVGKRMRPALSVTALGHAILEDFAEFFDDCGFGEDELETGWEAWTTEMEDDMPGKPAGARLFM